MSIDATRLPSGLSMVTERMPDVRSVAVGFWVAVGSRDEAPGLAGTSHFIEHLLFKGTESRSARQIAEAVDAVGGDMNAFTTKEYTAFYVRLLADHLDLGLDILSDIVWSPAFRPDDVEAERQVILEEILMHGDEPSDSVHDLFCEALFPGHPLGREVMGEASTIAAVSRDEIDEFFHRHYVPANMVVAAAGLFEPAELKEGLDRRFAGHDGVSGKERHAPLAPPRPTVVHTRSTEQAHVVLGLRALTAHDDDRYALAVLNHILGGGTSSRLFQEIREERGLAYSVYSYRSAYSDAGALAVYAGTAPARARQVVAIIHEHLDRLAADGVGEREVEVAKGHIAGSMMLSIEDSAARMSRLGRGQLVHGEVPTMDEVKARIQSVSLDDVARVAGRVLGNERVLAVVGPFTEDDFGSERVA